MGRPAVIQFAVVPGLCLLAVTTALLAQQPVVSEQPRQSATPGAVGSSEPEPAAIVIPEVNLEGLEPAIAEQLRALRVSATAALQAGDAKAAAETLADLARHYHAYEFYEAAAAGYRASLQLELEESSAYLLGLVLRELGESEEALQLFSLIASRQPNYLAARYYQALTLFDLGRFDQSRATVPEGTESPAFLVLLGRLALEFDEPAVAAGFFEDAIERAPAANRTYYLLAQAYRAAGEREKATAALESYGPVGAKPADPLMDGIDELRVGSTPFALAGRRAFAAGRYEEAAELFRRALAADPEDSGLKVNLASALAQAGVVDEPIGLLQSVVAAEPDSGVAQFNLGVLLRKAGKLEEAVVALSAAVALVPTDTVARAELVKALAGLDREEEALAALETLHGTPQHSEQLRLLELQLLINKQDFDGATKLVEEALAALPSAGLIAHAAARFFATVPSLEHRDGGRALDLASRVYEATGAPEDAVTVALALAELGKCAKAAEWMATASEGFEAANGRLSPGLQQFWERAQQGEDCRPDSR